MKNDFEFIDRRNRTSFEEINKLVAMSANDEEGIVLMKRYFNEHPEEYASFRDFAYKEINKLQAEVEKLKDSVDRVKP